MPGTPTSLRTRREKLLVWERAEKATGGEYARDLQLVTKKFPMLTLTEARVCALVKSGMTSWQIANFMGLSYRTVDNHRTNISRKIGPYEGRLAKKLQKI